jgi:hypothetical protein
MSAGNRRRDGTCGRRSGAADRGVGGFVRVVRYQGASLDVKEGLVGKARAEHQRISSGRTQNALSSRKEIRKSGRQATNR